MIMTEEDYSKAIRGCGPLALRRLFKKMTKRKYGKAEFSGVYSMWVSPLTGEARMRLDTSKEHGFTRQLRSPMDLDKYITNFVLTHKDKPPVREYKGE